MARAPFFLLVSICRARVASVRYGIFVWQGGPRVSFKDGSALIARTFIAVTNSEGEGNPAPVRLRGSIIIYRCPVNARAHNCYNCSSVNLFP